MANLLPGTDIELGKWYKADQYPPDLRAEHFEDKYELLLGIQGFGIRSGFFVQQEKRYYWHCERYDDFDHEDIPGWTFVQEVNNNLDLVYEVARGLSCWMIVPDFDNSLPSYDGTNYYDLDPDENYGTEDDEDDEDRPTTEILPIIPN